MNLNKPIPEANTTSKLPELSWQEQFEAAVNRLQTLINSNIKLAKSDSPAIKFPNPEPFKLWN